MEASRNEDFAEDKGPSESEGDDKISMLLSPLFQKLYRLVCKCDKCPPKMIEFLTSETETQGVEPKPAGVADSFKGQHGHHINDYWKLLRNACLSSEKGDNQTNNVSALWTQLLESEIFMQETPQGNTVLHMAAEHGDEHLVKNIIGDAPQLLTTKGLSTGDTALHVAAKAGHFSVLKKLIGAHFQNSSTPQEALANILEKNDQGNNFFHEALINGHQGVMNALVSHEDDGNLKEVAQGAALSITSNEKKSGVYLAIEAGYKHVVDQAFTKVIPNDPDYVPEGKPLLLAAIIKQDQGILDTILTKKPEWIHLTDTEGRVPLHYAASIGYLEGVRYLLKICASCIMQRDEKGFLPIHLASYAGHVKVVQELLKPEYCTDPRDILHKDGRNILHLAAQSGKLSVVKHILQASDHGLGKMINEKDYNGNTPLHLATLCCHPKIVHALTWDKRVDICAVNRKCQTALDAFNPTKNASFREHLTWTALMSVGVQSVEPKSLPIMVPPESTYEFKRQKGQDNMDPYKDRISTILLVSTLIITATFATGFTLPAGTNGSSDPGQGMAVMLHHIWFKLFIFCNTISMYGGISVTIILIWAQLGDIALALFAIKVARPLLGITLATLSLSFLAGVHLVISNLTWLDTSILGIGLLFIFMLLLLYTMLWFPSSTSNVVIRYISYYPFLLFASLVEHNED